MPLRLILYICSMEISDATVDKIAGLARLRFEADEKIQIKKDMQSMIGFIEKMNELDTSQIEPLLHMSTNTNSTREDFIQNSISNEEAMKNATKNKAPHFIVPTVIKK